MNIKDYIIERLTKKNIQKDNKTKMEMICTKSVQTLLWLDIKCVSILQYIHCFHNEMGNDMHNNFFHF